VTLLLERLRATTHADVGARVGATGINYYMK